MKSRPNEHHEQVESRKKQVWVCTNFFSFKFRKFLFLLPVLRQFHLLAVLPNSEEFRPHKDTSDINWE